MFDHPYFVGILPLCLKITNPDQYGIRVEKILRSGFKICSDIFKWVLRTPNRVCTLLNETDIQKTLKDCTKNTKQNRGVLLRKAMQIEMSNKLTIGLADILERNCSLRILEIGVSAHQGVKIFCRSTTPLAPLAVLAYGAPVIRWWLKDTSAILHSQNKLSNDKSFNILCFSSD